MSRLVLPTCLLIVVAGAADNGNTLMGREVDYASDVAPIFQARCFECHGVDTQESGLRLDRRASLIAGGDSGEPALSPGSPMESHLLSLVTSQDPNQRMPPEGDPLTGSQIQILSDWIKGGAVMPDELSGESALTTDHWSFQKLQSPKVPRDHAADVANDIDRFISSRLKALSLRLSNRAEDDRLIRRLFLVMHGLPPTPRQSNVWLKRLQDDHDKWWPKLVEEVLASPRYGERWARHWLDIVRFGETHGFETNRERPNSWHYRDYVIDALNEDLPYDQFVREQIVGDASGADAATGFLVAGPHDLVKSPDRNLTLMQRQDELADLINVTGTTFLGLTLGCARCHNHKFDPITQRDFYAVQAVFAGVNHGDRALPLTTKQQTRLREIEQRTTELKGRLLEFVPESSDQIITIDDDPAGNMEFAGLRHLVPRIGQGLNPKGDQRGYADDRGGINGSSNVSGGAYSWWKSQPGQNVAAWQPNVTGRFRLWISWGCGHDTHTEDARYLLDSDGNIETSDDQSLIATVDQKLFADGTGRPEGKSLWSGFLDGGVHTLTSGNVILLQAGDTGTAVTADVLVLEPVPDGSPKKSMAGPPRRPAVDAKHNRETIRPTDARFVRFTILGTNSGEPCIDELEVWSGTRNLALASVGTRVTSSGDLPGYEIHQLKHIHDGAYGNSRSWISNESGSGWVLLELPEVATIDRIEWARDREGRYADRLATRYKIELSLDGEEWSTVATSESRAAFAGRKTAEQQYDFSAATAERAASGRAWLEELRALEVEKKDVSKATIMYAGVFGKPAATYRLYRGDPLSPREEMAPDTLQILGSLGLDSTSSEQVRRQRFADWLTDADNPLTARVIVNRIWQHHFGTGIVSTPNDFGLNGVPPSHPELLDWMSIELIRNQWSLKHLHRLILNSATWRQDSRPDSVGSSIDASSRYLWRFPPRRLEAEAIRDAIVSVSGVLDLKMGGPGFSGFQVEMENVRHFFPKTEFGPADYRRMIYMTKVRQERESVFGAFDCPDASQVISARSRSTTPLQALNLLNSPFAVKQAELLASRLNAEATDVQQQVQLAYQLCFCREATDAEVKDSAIFIEAHSLSAFCRAMLNANEFLFIP